MNEQKNIEGLLQAFKTLSFLRIDWRLVLVGPLSPQLKKKLDRLAFEELVSFTGEISYAEVALQMQSAAALVLFSKHENLPCVLIEALCCGLPVIATSVGGVPELIDQNNGILVESDNQEQLIAAFHQMIDDYNRFDRKTISDKATNSFNPRAIGKQFYEWYLGVLGQS